MSAKLSPLMSDIVAILPLSF